MPRLSRLVSLATRRFFGVAVFDIVSIGVGSGRFDISIGRRRDGVYRLRLVGRGSVCRWGGSPLFDEVDIGGPADAGLHSR